MLLMAIGRRAWVWLLAWVMARLARLISQGVICLVLMVKLLIMLMQMDL